VRFLPSFLRSRAGLLVFVTASVLALRAGRPSLPPASREGLAELLGRAVGGVVEREDLAWEPSGGFLADALGGRGLVFLASGASGEPRDLYRGWVRLGIDGKPSAVLAVRNLTRTPLGDDAGLRLLGSTVSIVTRAFGRIQAVSVFDLAGVPRDERLPGLGHRIRHGITAWRRTGAVVGVGRTDVVLDLPVERAAVRMEPGRLVIDLGEGSEGMVLDLVSRRALAPDGSTFDGARVVRRPAEVPPFSAWAADELRALFGVDAVLWLEHRLFGARDRLERTAHGLLGRGASPRVVAGSAASVAQPQPSWPPPRVAPLLDGARPDEGKWSPVAREWLPRAAAPVGDAPPPYFYRTYLRPDPERPYAEVHLVALDMRQLEIRMIAGYEDPAPLVGPPGTGRLPEDAQVLDRVAATFNGAFKTTHGEYGMMVDRRVLVPAVPGAATAVLTHDHELGLGTWPESKELPGDVVSFRQNLDPLVADGIPNPAGRRVWGWHLAGQEVQTERTALCVTGAGHALYAWGKSVSGPRLAEALVRAGCDYAIHLDMNPTYCGFVFTRIEDLARHAATLELAHPDMTLPADRFVRWSPKDFFYVLVRDTSLPRVLGASWMPAGVQPEPSWLPGVFDAKAPLGGLEVRLIAFEKGRFEWVVRAGAHEPSVSGAAPKRTALDEADLARAHTAINLGRTTERTGYGLAFGKRESLGLRRPYASLVLEPGRTPRVYEPGQLPSLREGREIVQLPLLVQAGEVLPDARRPGAHRLRGGLCVTPLGRVLYAEAHHDNDHPVASALIAAGCSLAVSTDRGSHHPAFVDRAGSGSPPRAGYETSVLHALARAARPRAFTWRPEAAAEP
jgi:hypothetical protein